MYHPAAPEDESEINLTPMLDVVFIMLIFFLVTATFLNEKGLDVSLPYPSLEPVEVESISVLVQADRSFVVNGRPLSKSSLIPYVHALHAQNPEAGYSVRLGDDSRVADIVAAIEAGRRIGLDVVPVSPAD